jgi:hypothetical protein
MVMRFLKKEAIGVVTIEKKKKEEGGNGKSQIPLSLPSCVGARSKPPLTLLSLVGFGGLQALR